MSRDLYIKAKTPINSLIADMFEGRVLADGGTFEAKNCLVNSLDLALFQQASLIIKPNGRKSGKIYALKPFNGTGDLTVVRATTATEVNASSVIVDVASNVARFDYTNASCPSILVEPQRTNLIKYSSDLSQSIWLKANYTLSITTTIQGLNSTRITKNATSNGAYNATGGRNLIHNTGILAVGTKTLSILIRKGNTEKVGFLINSVLVGALTSVICEFNFNTKTFTNVSAGLTVSYENPLTDVYKIILTINDTGVLTNKAIWIAPIDASNNTVTGGYLDFAFAQWELGSNATSYIPTVASAVTRNADVISKTGLTGITTITETFEDGSTNVIGGIPTSYTMSQGRIKSVIGI